MHATAQVHMPELRELYWSLAPELPCEKTAEITNRNVVVLIPAYNEERFIGSVVLKARRYATIVIVIDDGSSDATADIAARAGARVVRHVSNQGKGAALNTGFGKARELAPDAIVMIDGDGQHCPEEMESVLAPVLNGDADIVVGSRYLEHRSDVPRHRVMGHWGFNLLTKLASGTPASDSQSGYRTFSPRAIEAISFSSQGFSVESEMQFWVHDLGLRLKEVPITIRYQDKPKRNVMKHGLLVLNGILQLVGQYRPLLFFAIPGLVLLLAGLASGFVFLERYMQTQQLAGGYVLMAVMFCSLSFVLISIGIMLHSVRAQLLEFTRQWKNHA
jgi:glycosyltransferase involved in cell wall biosynthesis